MQLEHDNLPDDDFAVQFDPELQKEQSRKYMYDDLPGMARHEIVERAASAELGFEQHAKFCIVTLTKNAAFPEWFNRFKFSVLEQA